MKKRQANFELLRVIAMLMIITLHYLDKGGILPAPGEPFGAAGLTAWLLEAFCVSAVNVYVLLGAYFLVEQDYEPMRAVRLWGQVLFYSIFIGAACVIAGIVPMQELTLYKLLIYLMPVTQEHYWFATAYIVMLLFAPLMNRTLRELPEKTFRRAIVLLLLLLSVANSVLPVRLPIDRMGYDALWFLVLYLIGAFLRLHGDSLKITTGMAVSGYALSSGLIFASMLVVNAIYQRTGSLLDFINRQYHYNGIFCLGASVFLFFIFRKLYIPEGRTADWSRRAASVSFGVYLIHEHIDLRYFWPKFLGVQKFSGTLLFLLQWAVTILVVYAVCGAIELLRQYLKRKVWNRHS